MRVAELHGALVAGTPGYRAQGEPGRVAWLLRAWDEADWPRVFPVLDDDGEPVRRNGKAVRLDRATVTLVLLTVASFANNDGEEARASVAKIRKRAKLADRQAVTDALGVLRRLRYIEKTAEAVATKRGTTYRLALGSLTTVYATIPDGTLITIGWSKRVNRSVEAGNRSVGEGQSVGSSGVIGRSDQTGTPLIELPILNSPPVTPRTGTPPEPGTGGSPWDEARRLTRWEDPDEMPVRDRGDEPRSRGGTRYRG